MIELRPPRYNSEKIIILFRGAKQGGSQPPLNFGWGVEHLSVNPPDFEKKNFSGGWLPLN